MDDIMRRIAHIIDHEAFDGDGTLGQQVADRLAPVLADVWDHGWNNGADYMADDGDALYLANNPFNAYRTEAERRRAVFEVMDLEDELEQQERHRARLQRADRDIRVLNEELDAADRERRHQ